jgi:hypothetical protein
MYQGACGDSDPESGDPRSQGQPASLQSTFHRRIGLFFMIPVPGRMI